MIRNVIKSICMFAIMASVSRAEIIYSNPTDVHVTGMWDFSDEDAVLVTPMNFPIDLNHDGVNDVSINHHFVRRVHRIERDAFELLQMANLGQREVFSLLKEVRSIALDAANEGVNDADTLMRFQIQLDSKLDRINRISETTDYNGQKLLDGSAGMMGTASNSNVTVLNVADTVQTGTYAFTVDTSGARATTLAESALVNPLAQDETLTINGVKVDLYAGMTGTQVQDRINEFTNHTGVTGHIVRDGFDAGKLRFSGVAFGHASSLDIISNVAGGTADASSVGTTLIQESGVDMVATIGGTQFNGHGNTVTADSGLGRGLSLAVSPVDSADNHHLTVAGQQGTVHIQDQSLSFPLTATQDEAVNIALRTLHSSSLGIGVLGNQFAHLSKIDVTSASKAQDALVVIDNAVGTVRAQVQNVDSMMDDFFLPFGEATVEGIGLAEFAVKEGEIGLLSTGEPIGPTSSFSDEPLSIGSLEFGGAESAFLGVRLTANDKFHYGWIRTELAEDESLIIRDYAFESSPNQHIRAGFVPEPSGPAFVILGSTLATLGCRVIRRQRRR